MRDVLAAGEGFEFPEFCFDFLHIVLQRGVLSDDMFQLLRLPVDVAIFSLQISSEVVDLPPQLI